MGGDQDRARPRARGGRPEGRKAGGRRVGESEGRRSEGRRIDDGGGLVVNLTEVADLGYSLSLKAYRLPPIG